MCVQWVQCVQSVYTVYTQRHARGRARPTRAARTAVLPGYTVPDTCALWYSVPVQIHQNFVMRACMNHRARAPLPRARERNRLHEIFRMHFIDERTMHDHRRSKFGRFGFGHACWGSLLDHQYWSDRRLPHLYGFRTHSPVTCRSKKFNVIHSFSG